MTRPDVPAGESALPEVLDVSGAVVTGVTTALWYAVPDAVGPRWGRALAKTAVAVGGFGLGLGLTAEGRAARAGLRAVDGADDVDDAPDDPADLDDLDAPDGLAGRVSPAAAAAVVTVSLGAAAALAVAGEKWTYGLGERWRARGRSLPHTRVGLVMGALAAGLTLLEPRPAGGVGADLRRR